MNTERHVVSNVHVYFTGSEYYVPTVTQRANGTWLEMVPVARVASTQANELANAIDSARARSALRGAAAKPWDGDNGRVWWKAHQLWSLYGYDDGALLLVPKYLVPIQTDPETGEIVDGGWADDMQSARWLPGGMPALQIAQLLMM